MGINRNQFKAILKRMGQRGYRTNLITAKQFALYTKIDSVFLLQSK